MIDFHQLVLFGILCASTHWILARSSIMEPIWSRFHGVIGRLLACAGCSGFWLGLILWLLGVHPYAVPGGTFDVLHTMLEFLVTACLAVFVTPVFESVLLWGLQQSAVEFDPTPRPAEDADSGSEEITPNDRPPMRR